MSPRWEDLNARARGLATHLAPRTALQELAETPDLMTLAHGCAALGLIAAEPEDVTAVSLELAVRRGAARNLGVIVRWLGPRAPWLRIVLEEEDRRSLHALLRGAAAGVAAELRLAGLIPTPSLPERLLEELARQTRVRDLAALLVIWNHPYGSPLLVEAGAETPDLFRLECALNQTFARRASAGSRQGGRELRDWVEEAIDLENLRGALVLASGEQEVSIAAAFLPGGRRISLEQFSAAAHSGDPQRAVPLLAPCFEDSTAQLIRRHATRHSALDNAILAHRLDRLRDRARRDPLGPAPLLWYLLRLRAQAVRLRFLIWSKAISLPAPLRRERLEEVA
ncbi:MAG TPA: V-type ATPase subunit [Gemmatimonadales bacterium]|jgi:vacuolar-type H+-ATPase subunit C/Vma6